MRILTFLSIILAISTVNVRSLPIITDNEHPPGILKDVVLNNTPIHKRVVNYNNDAGSVAAATTVDTTTAAIAGLDSAGKVGAATGTEVVNALVDAGRTIISIAGTGLGAAGSSSLAGNFPAKY